MACLQHVLLSLALNRAQEVEVTVALSEVRSAIHTAKVIGFACFGCSNVVDVVHCRR